MILSEDLLKFNVKHFFNKDNVIIKCLFLEQQKSTNVYTPACLWSKYEQYRKHIEDSCWFYMCPVCRSVYFVVKRSTFSPSRVLTALQWSFPQFSGFPCLPSSSLMYSIQRSNTSNYFWLISEIYYSKYERVASLKAKSTESHSPSSEEPNSRSARS